MDEVAKSEDQLMFDSDDPLANGSVSWAPSEIRTGSEIASQRQQFKTFIKRHLEGLGTVRIYKGDT